MPFIKVNVMGRVSPNGNGTFYVDGRGYYNVKNGLVVMSAKARTVLSIAQHLRERKALLQRILKKIR